MPTTDLTQEAELTPWGFGLSFDYNRYSAPFRSTPIKAMRLTCWVRLTEVSAVLKKPRKFSLGRPYTKHSAISSQRFGVKHLRSAISMPYA